MTFALLAAGLVIGIVCARFNWINESMPDRINFFIINVALPAMILLKVPSLTIDANALVPVASSWFVILSTAAIVLTLGKILNWSDDTLGALLLVVPLSNSAYLGLPLLNALTDDTVVAYGAFYDQFGNFMALSIYAPLVVAVFAGKKNREKSRSFDLSTLATIGKNLFLFVPFPVLIIAACFLNADSLPEWSYPPLQVLGASMGPLAAFIVGFSLRFTVPKSLRVPLLVGAGVRLIVAPLLLWFGLSWFSVADSAVKASVLQGAMPSMITAGLVGIAAGFSKQLIIAMLSVTSLVSVITLLVFFNVLV